MVFAIKMVIVVIITIVFVNGSYNFRYIANNYWQDSVMVFIVLVEFAKVIVVVLIIIIDTGLVIIILMVMVIVVTGLKRLFVVLVIVLIKVMVIVMKIFFVRIVIIGTYSVKNSIAYGICNRNCCGTRLLI